MYLRMVIWMPLDLVLDRSKRSWISHCKTSFPAPGILFS